MHARQRGLTDILDSIGRQLALPPPPDGWAAANLIAALVGMDRQPILIVDALDECPEADALQAVLLIPLARARRPDTSPAVRLLVGTRPWLERFTPLLEHAQQGEQLSDLDQLDRRQLCRDLRRYLIDLFSGLSQQEALAEGIAGRLADDYERRRHEPAASRWGHFLVAGRYAGYVRDHPSESDAQVAALLDTVPVDLPQVLEMELASHPRPHHLRAALAALAFAKGEGMPVELLRVVAAELGPADPELFAGEDARLYLRTSSEPDGVALLRLYHQGLADYLREHPISAAEHQDLVVPVAAALLRTRDTGGGPRSWEYAPDYLLRHAIQHTADAGIIDQLLTDSEFLTHARPEPLLAELDHARTAAGRLGAAIYRSVHHLLNTDALTRRRLIELAARRYGAEAPHVLLPGRQMAVFEPRWATGSQLHPALRRTMRAGSARAIACTQVNGRSVAVVGSAAGAVRVWDLATGEPVGAPLVSGTGRVVAVACTVLDDRPIAVVGSIDGTVLVWDLVTGEPVGAPLANGPADALQSVRTRRPQRVTAVACSVLEGRAVAVASSADDRLWMWDLATGEAVGAPLHLRPADSPRSRLRVTAMACSVLDGRPAVVVGSSDGSVRVWDLVAGEPVGVLHVGGAEQVTAAACCVMDGRPVAVTGSVGRLRIWDMSTGEPVGAPLDIGTGQITALTCTVLEGQPIAVACRAVGVVQVLDLASGEPAGAPFAAHTGPVEMAACTVLAGRPVTVTVSLDGSVRVWDLTATEPVGDPVDGHQRRVTAVVCTVLDGHQVAVTGSLDGTLRVWDLAAGKPVGTPLRSAGRVTAVACTVLDGRQVAVTGDRDGTVRVWDLATGEPGRTLLVSGTRRIAAVACTELDGRPVAVTGDRAVRVWDLATGEPISAFVASPRRQVTALAPVVLAGRQAVVASSTDGMLHVWDLAAGERVGAPIASGTKRRVTAMAPGVVAGQPVAVIGSADRAVRVWDLAAGKPVGAPLACPRGATTAASTAVDGRPIAVTGSRDGTVSIWDLQDRSCIDTWRMWDAVSAIAFSSDGRRVIAAAGWDLAVFTTIREGQK